MAAQDQKLSELWAHRSTLNEAEWRELCLLVMAALQNYHCQELATLLQWGEERQELIQDFLLTKVLRISNTRCDHIGALRMFFRNFLLDRIRTLGPERERFDSESRDEGSSTPEIPDERKATWSEQLLEHIAKTPEQVAQAARDWLGRQEAWVRLYLGLYQCLDTDELLRQPLYKLAKRYGISSYHHKAKKLGISFKGSPEDYRKTMLGGWLEELGFKLTSEEAQAIRAALEILCLEVREEMS